MATIQIATEQHSKFYWMIADALTITKRNLLNYVRIPQSKKQLKKNKFVKLENR